MRKHQLLSVLLLMSVFLSGCGTKLNEKLVTKDIISTGTTQNDLSLEEYMLITQNDKFSFYFNKDTTAYKIVDLSDGYTWYSTAASSQKNIANDAPFSLKYVNSSGVIENMDAMTASISLGQYSYERTGKGINVSYSIGDFSELLLVPLAVNEERIKEIAENIDDEFARGQFEFMYQKTDISQMDEKNKKIFLEKYPKLKEGPLYFLRDSITASDAKMKELALLLADSGYTEEMYEADKEFFVLGEPEEDLTEKPRFRVQINYELKEDGLSVTIPAEKIQMTASCPIVSIELSKYFASPQRGDEGYFLLPDGSGSIMNFYNGRGNLQDYNIKMYGVDYSAAGEENVYNYEQAYLPVYAVKNGSKSMFAVIEKGDAISEINAYPGNEQLNAYVAPTFNVRSYYKSYLSNSSSTTNYFVNVQNERYMDDISVKYVFLKDTEATLEGMADWYSDYLFGSDKPKVSDTPGAVVEFVGQIDKDIRIAGIKNNKQIATTTFKQAEEITKELNEAGLKGLSVKLSGWFGGSYRGSFAGNTKINKLLGGDSGFSKLSESLKKQNIDFFPDVDLQYTYKTHFGDGYSSDKDTVTLLSREKGYKIEFNPATFQRDSKYHTPAYINNADSIERAGEKFFENFKGESVSLRNMGTDLNGDYGETKSTYRQQMVSIINKGLKEKSKDLKIMTSGVNAYILKYISYCTDVPLTSNERDNCNESVPFVEMVISGYIRYSGSPVNLSGGSEMLILRMAAVAADPYYLLTAQNSYEVNSSDFTFLYCSNYDYLKSDLINKVTEYQENMEGLSGKKITSYKKLQQYLYRTEFENGAAVTVNYGVNDIQQDGVLYSAKSYKVER